METKTMQHSSNGHNNNYYQTKPPSKIVHHILFEISAMIGGSIYIVLSMLFARGGIFYYSAFVCLVVSNIFGALGFANRVRRYRQLALGLTCVTLILFFIVIALIGTELLQPQTNGFSIFMDSLLMMVWVGVTISMMGRYIAPLMTTKK